MARKVTLFTGQWADLPLDDLAGKAAGWGFDGFELACWGDHFEVDKAIADPGYAKAHRAKLEQHGLGCWAIGAHLVGQAVCDVIDGRHQGILPPEVWGDGEPEGVRQRAAERMKDTARAAAQFGVTQVNGFTGSSIWHLLYSFPPNDFAAIEAGYQDFAERWGPIIDVFDAEGVRFGLEVHPTEIAYDFVTTQKTLDAIGNRAGLRDQLRPEPPRVPVPRLGGLRRGVRLADLPRPRQGREEAAHRPALAVGVAPQLRRGRARLGLRLARARRRRLRGAHPLVESDRLRRAALDRVGGFGNGSGVGGAGRARVRPEDGLRSLGSGL